MRRETETRTIRRQCFDMKEIYLLSCTEAAEGGGVYKYGLTETGDLKKITYLLCPKPMYAAFGGERLHILLRSPFESSDNSGYFSCKTDFTDCSNRQNTLGKCACHLAIDKDAYIVNYLSGNIVKNCEKVVFHSGTGVNLPRQDMPHTHFVAFSPDKKYVLCCDLGLDAIYIYDRDLNEVSQAKVPNGYGVRHLAFSTDHKYIYAVNELVPSISVFAYSNGEAEYLSTTKLDCKNKNSTAAAIRLDENQNRLYVSVRGENEIFVFNADNADLFFCGRFSCGGDGPRDFDLIGDFVVCTNENSDNVTVIEKDGYRVVNELPLKNPLNVVR